MDRSRILAHRGLWRTPVEKNSSSALSLALGQGFGLETDIRDFGGRLVISHDPPATQGLMSLGDLLAMCQPRPTAPRLALNVKADGLQSLVSSELLKVAPNAASAFAFDASVPDALSYLRHGIPTYTRVSEYETQPSFLDMAAGVWVDNFTGSFPQIEAAVEFLARGKRVALVSPELHGRDHAPVWQQILDAGLPRNPMFEICTDFPLEAHAIFGTT